VSAHVSDDGVIDGAAVQAFTEEFGDQATRLPPVAIVIAAFNEEGAIGPVVEGLPRTVGGLAAAAIVVSDGSVDATGKEAREAGALVCDVPVNRGQGAALRLGYRLAREGGADYIVTTDADGQYNPAEIEGLIAPILAGQADFVTGSRTLGSEETKDPVRKLGVRVFALTISVLTGQRISDTTFGLRAMRAEVTSAVLLEQPQYQASELLIGTITHGFRVAERPATIHRRQVGKSKKGNNAFYALSFAKVVFGTWWRERRRRQHRPAARTAGDGSGPLAGGSVADNPQAAPATIESAPRGQ
jgi:glycosyltransferase involved in cell wall biosynthesis